MKVLVFDTETTGLPKAKRIDQGCLVVYIIQLSCIIYDSETTNIITCVDDIIRLNDDVNFTQKLEMHKITREISKEKGIPIRNLFTFNEYVYMSDVVVGRNVMFDKMVMVGSNRVNNKQYFTNVKEYCTEK